MHTLSTFALQCLKESIIKATGVGIHDNLAKLDFRVDANDRYRPGCLLSSTKLMEDDRVLSEWVFEESFLDQLHCVAVCREVIFSLGQIIISIIINCFYYFTILNYTSIIFNND